MSDFPSSQQASERPEVLLGGRYRLIEPLGEGGFGQTFLAQDLHLPGKPRCVIKRLQPQVSGAASFKTAKRLFDTEAEVLYQLGDHDQIPRLLAHFEHEQKFYLAQELVVGEPLTETLLTDQPWTEAQVVAFLQDLLAVLTFVHQQNVIHRDIKPANLIRRATDGKIVLIDFGAVKQVSASLSHSNPGAAHTISIGTQGYMPNEQLAGTPRFSSDIYAVGMVGIQALTGILPRSLGLNPRTSEVEWQHLTLGVSSELIAVLTKMTRYDFRTRYATAAEALAAIEQIATGVIANQVASQEESNSGQSLLPVSPTYWQTASEQSSQSAQQLQQPTPMLTLRLSIASTPKTLSLWLSKLSESQQVKSRKLILLLAEFAALGGLIMIIRVLPFSALFKQLPVSSSASSPASSPTPNPVEAATLLSEADQLRQQGQTQQALDRYQQAIALNPQLVEAEWGRCYSLNVLENFTEAIAACDAALKINPSYAKALWSKGYALDQQQQDQQALELYEQAIGLQPDLVEAWNNKGTALLQLNRATEAVAAFEQATRLKPDFAEAWNNRGAALWSLQRFEEAVLSVDQALKIRPDYQDALQLRQQMRQELAGYLRRQLRR